jgi:hypothetical protein
MEYTRNLPKYDKRLTSQAKKRERPGNESEIWPTVVRRLQSPCPPRGEPMNLSPSKLERIATLLKSLASSKASPVEAIKWPQFSLRDMLVAIAAICVLCALPRIVLILGLFFVVSLILGTIVAVMLQFICRAFKR